MVKIVLIVLLINCILGIILWSHYLNRNDKVEEMLLEIIKYISKKAREEIDRGDHENWKKYYVLYDNKVNQNKLVFDLRINLDGFKEDFINQINKINQLKGV